MAVSTPAMMRLIGCTPVSGRVSVRVRVRVSARVRVRVRVRVSARVRVRV